MKYKITYTDVIVANDEKEAVEVFKKSIITDPTIIDDFVKVRFVSNES